ncbi:prolipoprotein diacylglyceryl transferase [Catellatospora sp. IY07-71]|uniref:prolipoprotein diacylglyceryl transferase n=1 Tax=Catellatospora sp. IY07-71 TaxID=2728827 RepID=UPI001BB4602A|nr:prolipoprotein diacylglyceryl transferase [Catellatospora sp. IY07-71]BCJ77743.1 prolipoprotein diacylglyceryl transferase [Catellatospora sp. IY07-71]
MNLASIPSPSTAVWHLGPVPLRAYALCIIAGIVLACIVTDRRMRSRGAPPWAVLDIAVWAVPFGIVGARIYHVLSSPDAYFGEGGELVKALYVWEGGLGIWGGVAGGALGAWLACRQLGMSFSFVADCIAVGLPLAQAVGRLGNWFNNELYGGRTDLPWGLQVHVMSDTTPGQAMVGPDGEPELREGLYHPTFLYELLWNLGVAGVVYWLDKRYKFGKGRAFALYVMLYTLGRGWIEAMRTDPATMIGGLRLNVWTSIIVFLAAAAYFFLVKGVQEFLIPNVDAEGEPVKGFQTVTEEQYQAFLADGSRPDAITDTPSDGTGDEPGGPADEADSDGPADLPAQKTAAKG